MHVLFQYSIYYYRSIHSYFCLISLKHLFLGVPSNNLFRSYWSLPINLCLSIELFLKIYDHFEDTSFPIKGFVLSLVSSFMIIYLFMVTLNYSITVIPF